SARHFQTARHDDQVDAMTQALLRWNLIPRQRSSTTKSPRRSAHTGEGLLTADKETEMDEQDKFSGTGWTHLCRGRLPTAYGSSTTRQNRRFLAYLPRRASGMRWNGRCGTSTSWRALEMRLSRYSSAIRRASSYRTECPPVRHSWPTFDWIGRAGTSPSVANSVAPKQTPPRREPGSKSALPSACS